MILFRIVFAWLLMIQLTCGKLAEAQRLLKCLPRKQNRQILQWKYEKEWEMLPYI
jgi:hypothetical protein